MAAFTELEIVSGFESAASMGFTGFTDPPIFAIDLIGGVLIVQDDGGEGGYRPQLATLKGGGSFVETPLSDGRQLVAASNDNVIETMTLVTSASLQSRMNALKDLQNVMRLLHDFETTNGATGRICYIKAWFSGATWPQYTRIRKMELDIDVDFMLPDESAVATFITLTIERDPFWTDIPPASNPKVYAFLKRGLERSTVTGAPAAGQYNHTNVSLGAFGGAADYQNYIESTIYNVEEITHGTRNVVIIPAASIPGDMPALCQFNFSHQNTPYGGKLLVSRSTARDYFPANDVNTTTQRLRSNFNGADSTLITAGGVTGAYFADAANGLRYTGGGAARRNLQLSTGGGAVTGGGGGQWFRGNDFNHNYNVFVRLYIATGTPANITLELRPGNKTQFPTLSRTLAGIPALTWTTFYLGKLNLLGQPRGLIGLGTEPNDVEPIITLTKPNDGVAVLMYIADVIWMPYDEQSAFISGSSAMIRATYDGSGYFAPAKDAYSQLLTSIAVSPFSVAQNGEYYGQPITLLPNVENRLWFLKFNNSIQPTDTYRVTINIVPRWSSPRVEG